MKKYLLLLIVAIVSLSCSKEDDSKTENQTLDGGTVYTYEFAKIERGNINNETYSAYFNGSSIEVNKINENQIGFIVDPEIATIGETNLLEIPSLNIKVEYNVLNTVLVDTPEETLQPLINNLNIVDASSTEQGDKIQLFIDNFTSYYNNLSVDEKQLMAEFYLANETLFINSLNISGRNVHSPILDNLTECQSYTYATGVFGVLAAFTSGPMPIVSVLCSAGAVVSFKNAIETCGTFADENIKNTFVQAENQIFDTERQQMVSEIVFNNEETKTVPFLLGMRSLNTSDSNDSNVYISIFFESINTINTTIQEKLNTAIEYYNSNVPSLLEIEPFDIININTNTISEQLNLTTELFDAMTFSVANNNVEIQSVSYNSSGAVNLQLKIVDPSQVVSGEVNTTLNFTYTDDFNNVSGAFPITVLNEGFTLVGNWALLEFNGLIAGEWDEPTCPRSRMVSGSMVFAIATFSGSFLEESEGTETDQNGNTVCSSIDSYSDSLSGDYESDGSSYSFVNASIIDNDGEAGDMTGSISVIDNNTIQVNIIADWGGGDIINASCKYSRQ